VSIAPGSPPAEIRAGAETADSVGDEDLATVGFGGDARGEDHRRAEEITVFLNRFSRVDTDPHVQRFVALTLGERPLQCDGALDGFGHRPERGHEAVAHRLHLGAAVCVQRLPHDAFMLAKDFPATFVAQAGHHLLDEADLPPEFGYLKLESSGERSREELINDSFAPEDEARDLEQFSVVTVWESSLMAPDTDERVWVASSVIRVYENSGSASLDYGDELSDTASAIGTANSDGTYLVASERVGIEKIGDRADGLILTLGSDPDTSSFYMSFVFFKIDRVVAGVALFSLNEPDLIAEAHPLATTLAGKIETEFAPE
jgi:hypothetical protein